MSSLKTQFITHNPFSTCLEIPHYGQSRTVRLQALGSGQGQQEEDGSGRGNIAGLPRLSQQEVAWIYLQWSSVFILCATICTYLFLFFEPDWLFFITDANTPHLLCPPSLATLVVSQPEQRNVRLDDCSSGNVPFQSAFAPEISTLILLRRIPAKTGIWWEGNVEKQGVGEWSTVHLLRMEQGRK